MAIRRLYIPLTVLAAALALTGAFAQSEPVEFLYKLSDFTGTIPYNEVRLHADRFHDELYVAEANRVRVFNDKAMEIYWFGYEPELGAIRDLAVDEAGDLWILAQNLRARGDDPKAYVVRCDYRGRPGPRIVPAGLPPQYDGFLPGRIFHEGDRLILVSEVQMQVVAVDLAGQFLAAHDLGEMVGIPVEERSVTEMGGFSLAPNGDMLFTVPVKFRAFVVSPTGEVRGFGRAGSGPGRFGLIGGIAADDRGRYYVAERLRSAIMIFDRQFEFLHEFGYAGDRPGNLIRPDQLEMGNGGKLFVTQVRSRGVSVFSVNSKEPIPRKEVPEASTREPAGGTLESDAGVTVSLRRIDSSQSGLTRPEDPEDGIPGATRIVQKDKYETSETSETRRKRS